MVTRCAAVCPKNSRLQTRDRLPALLPFSWTHLPRIQTLIHQFKKDAAAQEVPLIVALPRFSETAAAWALEAGADEFLHGAPLNLRKCWLASEWCLAGSGKTGNSSWILPKNLPGSSGRPAIPFSSASTLERAASSIRPAGAFWGYPQARREPRDRGGAALWAGGPGALPSGSVPDRGRQPRQGAPD